MTDHETVNAFLDLLARKGFRLVPPVLAAPEVETTLDPTGQGAHVHLEIAVTAPPQIVAAPGCHPSFADLLPFLQVIELDRRDRAWPEWRPNPA